MDVFLDEKMSNQMYIEHLQKQTLNSIPGNDQKYIFKRQVKSGRSWNRRFIEWIVEPKCTVVDGIGPKLYGLKKGFSRELDLLPTNLTNDRSV